MDGTSSCTCVHTSADQLRPVDFEAFRPRLSAARKAARASWEETVRGAPGTAGARSARGAPGARKAA
ncbi:hypothetical protein AN218_30280, partial [Streptomyces nanshensis]